MTDSYFDNMAASWDDNPIRQRLSAGIWCFVQSCCVLGDGVKAMDYGCGTGLMSLRLSQCVDKVYAVDSSKGMLEKLKEKINAGGIKNIELLNCDITSAPPLNISPELIFSAMALHHIQDTAGVISKFNSLLKPGGSIILADLCTEDGSFHKDIKFYHNGFNPEYIGSLLIDNGLQIVRSEIVFEIEKDDKTYPVFGVFAQKP